MPMLVALLLPAMLCVLALCGPAAAQSPPLAELAMYSGPDRIERLIEGAKKEGVLTVYTSVPADDMRVLIDAFEKKYGVKVQLWRAGSEKVLQPALTEQRAGRYDGGRLRDQRPEMESLLRERF